MFLFTAQYPYDFIPLQRFLHIHSHPKMLKYFELFILLSYLCFISIFEASYTLHNVSLQRLWNMSKDPLTLVK